MDWDSPGLQTEDKWKEAEIQLEDKIWSVSASPPFLCRIFCLSPSLFQSLSHWMKAICSDLNQLKRQNAESALGMCVVTTVFVFVCEEGRLGKTEKRRREWWSVWQSVKHSILV